MVSLLLVAPDSAPSSDPAPAPAPSAPGPVPVRSGAVVSAARAPGAPRLVLVPADVPAAVQGGPPAPLRLTDRGRRVVSGLAMAIGLSIAAVTVVGVQLHGEGGLQLAGSDTVLVRPGDTLWSIARTVAPDQDPRAVVDAIVELNGLDSVDLLPGAQLQLP